MIKNNSLFTFEKLHVWQEARTWVKTIYNITRSFPNKESFGLITQLNRAAVSVPTNIAEGSARKSHKDQAHFSNLAYSSLLESLNLLIIAFDQNYLSESELSFQRKTIKSIATKLNALHVSQEQRAKQK